MSPRVSSTFPVLRPAAALLVVLLAGLLHAVDQAPAPRLAPPPSDYHAPVPVHAFLAPLVQNAVIRFTLDGASPSETSPVWPGRWLVTDPTTIRLQTFVPGQAPSAVVVARYGVSFPLTAARPIADPPAGRFTETVLVSLSTTTRGATIRYTLDGSIPTQASAIYTQPIPISRSTRICAQTFGGQVAFHVSGRTIWLPAVFPSGVMQARYEIVPKAPVFTPAPGTFPDTLTVQMTSPTAGAVIRYTRDQSLPTESSPIAAPVEVSESTTLTARAFLDGVASDSTTGVYILQVGDPQPQPAGNTIFDRQLELSAAGATPLATYRYTLDGKDPDEGSPALPAILTRSAIVRIRGFREGFEPSAVVGSVYDRRPIVTVPDQLQQAPENDHDVRVRVTLDTPSRFPVTVDYRIDGVEAIADLDFSAAETGQLLFAPGDTAKEVVVRVLPDALNEATESLLVTLVAAEGGLLDPKTNRGVLAILDDDPPPTVRFASAASIVEEGTGVALIPLQLSAAAGHPVTASLVLEDDTAALGVDCEASSVSVTFAIGETEAVARIPVIDDDVAEGDETILVRLVPEGDLTVAEPILHRLTIRSDEFASAAADWFAIARNEVARHHTDPPFASRVYALLGVAQDRALRAWSNPAAPARTSAPGVISAASVAVLSALYPDRATALAATARAQTIAASWSGYPGEGVMATNAPGREAALQALGEAAGDGSAAITTGTPPSGPGFWYPSWSYVQPPLRPLWGQVRPWFLDDGAQLRPVAPPVFGSPAFTAALQEVREIADHRTDEQLRIAARWADGPGTATPTGHWCAIAGDLIVAKRLGAADAASLYALLGATMMDAGIICWDAKFISWYIRPYQADRSITTPIGQPNFPSYTSGHSTFSGAASEILADRFPDYAAQLRLMAEEASLSRLYGGIHYRFDCDIGLAMGRSLAAIVLADARDGTWRSDVTPRISIDAPTPGVISTDPRPRIRGRAHDDGPLVPTALAAVLVDDTGKSHPVEVSVTGGGEQPLAFGIQPAQALPDGLYVTTVTATDADGRQGVAVLRFGVDTNGAPAVTITAPANESLAGIEQVVTLLGHVDQPVASLTVNGTAVAVAGDLTFSVALAVDAFSALRAPLTLMGGLNELVVRAVDLAGRSGSATITVLVDDSRPSLRIETPADAATSAAAAVNVTGRVQDIVLGTLDSDNVILTVNGAETPLRNGAFLATGVALAPGENNVVVVAVDQAGNRTEQSIRVVRSVVPGIQVRVLAGDLQQALPHTTLQQALRVQVVDPEGTPIAGQAVEFVVTRGDGTLVDSTDDAGRRLSRLTGADGVAEAGFAVGSRAGLGNHRVSVSAVGSANPVEILASVLSGTAFGISIASGQQQTGVPGGMLPQPLVVQILDQQGNPLIGATATFTVAAGGGGVRVPGALLSGVTVDATTDEDGRATVEWVMGSTTGLGAGRVDATTPGLLGVTASFVASVVAPNGTEALISGVVLSTEHRPIPGVTLMIDGSTIGAVSDAHGAFRIHQARPGHRHLIVNGTTANHDAVRYPTIGFEVDLIAGVEVRMPMPIYLPMMDLANETLAGGDHEVVLPLPGVPGVEVVIAPHSTIRSDGMRGPVWMYTSPVNALAMPMPPPGGVFPPQSATLQPSGTRLDPPARVRWPNMQSLRPGDQTQILSFDHDLGEFVSQGMATVTEDGAYLVSDPGTGLTKAGWHFPAGTPIPTGSVVGQIPPDDAADEETEPSSIVALEISPTPYPVAPHLIGAGTSPVYTVTAILSESSIPESKVRWSCTSGTFTTEDGQSASGVSVAWQADPTFESAAVGDIMIRAWIDGEKGVRVHRITAYRIAGRTIYAAPGQKKAASSEPVLTKTPFARQDYNACAGQLRGAKDWKLKRMSDGSEVPLDQIIVPTSFAVSQPSGSALGIIFTIDVAPKAPVGEYLLFLSGDDQRIVHQEHIVITAEGFVEMWHAAPVASAAAPIEGQVMTFGFLTTGPQPETLAMTVVDEKGTAVAAGIATVGTFTSGKTDFVAPEVEVPVTAQVHRFPITFHASGTYYLRMQVDGRTYLSRTDWPKGITVVGARVSVDPDRTGVSPSGMLALVPDQHYLLPAKVFGAIKASNPVPDAPTVSIVDRWKLVPDRIGAVAFGVYGNEALGPNLNITVASVQAKAGGAARSPIVQVDVTPQPTSGTQIVTEARFILSKNSQIPQLGSRSVIMDKDGKDMAILPTDSRSQRLPLEVKGPGAADTALIGHIKPFRLTCAALDIKTPTGDPATSANASNEVVFDVDPVKPGTCLMRCELAGLEALPEEFQVAIAAKCQWTAPDVGPVKPTYRTPGGSSMNRGAVVDVSYGSMPPRFDDFGRKRVTLTLVDVQGKSSGFYWYQDAEFFYHTTGVEGARQHSGEPAENWFFYWSQIKKPRAGAGNVAGIVFTQDLLASSRYDYYWQPGPGGSTSTIVIHRVPGSLAGFLALLGHEQQHELDYYEEIWEKNGYRQDEDFDRDNLRDAWEQKQYGDLSRDLNYAFETERVEDPPGSEKFRTILAWSDERADKAGIDLLRTELAVNQYDWSDLTVESGTILRLQDEHDDRLAPVPPEKQITVLIPNNKQHRVTP